MSPLLVCLLCAPLFPPLTQRTSVRRSTQAPPGVPHKQVLIHPGPPLIRTSCQRDKHRLLSPTARGSVFDTSLLHPPAHAPSSPPSITGLTAPGASSRGVLQVFRPAPPAGGGSLTRPAPPPHTPLGGAGWVVCVEELLRLEAS